MQAKESPKQERIERRFHSQSDLVFESVRRRTFAEWKLPFVDPDKLAASGFYCLRKGDHVQCVFCEGIVHCWEEGDDPNEEHAKHFPNCPFVRGVPTGNVPLVRPNNDTGRAFELLDDYHTYKIANALPQVTPVNYQADAVPVAEEEGMAYPYLSTSYMRLQTFINWPKDTKIDPDKLVEAGFFYTGLADWVKCFHCGGGLFGWRKGDDPATDHFRFFPNCPFVSREEIAMNIQNKDPDSNSSSPRSLLLTDCEANLLLCHPIAQKVVSEGLSSAVVKAALKHHLETKGTLCRSVQEAIELVFDYDDLYNKSEPVLNQPQTDAV